MSLSPYIREDNTKEKAEVELNISSYLDVSILIVSFSRELFRLYSKQLFFNGNAYQKHTICENTTAKIQIIPRKWKALQKKNKYILISLNFRYKWEELCPTLIYWDFFVRIQGSIIKCVDVYCFFNFSFLKMNFLIQYPLLLPINFMVLVISYVSI